ARRPRCLGQIQRPLIRLGPSARSTFSLKGRRVASGRCKKARYSQRNNRFHPPQFPPASISGTREPMTENALSSAQSSAPALARLGQFEVRLAKTEAERHAAYRLRYEVFHRERGVDAPSMDHLDHIEADAFDPFCDHIIVIDTSAVTPGDVPAIVGTYRAMQAPAPGLGWYADTEFDLSDLIATHRQLRFCEVGRSCVAPSYRSMRTIEALWCGLWAYACLNGIDAYFGAASFPGTDPAAHALAL